MKIGNLRLTLFSPMCFLLVAVSSAQAGITDYNNGSTNTINSAADPNAIRISDAAGPTPTTVTLVAGGSIGTEIVPVPPFDLGEQQDGDEFSVLVLGTSVFNMEGGSTDGEIYYFENSSGVISGGTPGDNVVAADNANLTINDVDIVGDDVEALGDATVTINDGTFVEDLQTEDNGHLIINGGQFQVGDGTLEFDDDTQSFLPVSPGGFIESQDNGLIEILGGEFGVGAVSNNDWAGSIIATNDATVIIKGGTINGGGPLFTDPEDYPNGIADLAAFENGTIRIFGTDFEVFGVPFAGGAIPQQAGDVSGILADGTPFDLSFEREINIPEGFTGQIFLVPEPASFSLVLFGLAGYVVRRRKA